MIQRLLKYPGSVLFIWALSCRFLFWWAYDFKVSDCPDTYAFYHLAEKVNDFLVGDTHLSKAESPSISAVNSADQKTVASNSDYNPKAEFIGERSPGYPLLILLCGTMKPVVVVLQFILGALLSVLCFYFLQRLQFSKRFSFLIALLLPLYLPLFWYETFVLVESVALLLVTYTFYLFYPIFQGNQVTKKTIGILCTVLGFLVYIKPFFIQLPFLMVFVLFLKHGRKGINWKRQISLVLLPLLSYLSWSFVVYCVTGFFVSTTFYGLNKAQNCVYFAEKGPKEYQWLMTPYVKRREEAIRTKQDVAMSIWYAVNAGDYASKNMRFSELSAAMGDYASKTIQQNPGDYFYQVITRSWWDFWNAFDGKINYQMQKATESFETFYQFELIMNRLLKLIFLGLGILTLGVAVFRRQWDYWAALTVIIFGVSVSQGLVTYGENARFSYPFELLMFFFVIAKGQSALFMKRN